MQVKAISLNYSPKILNRKQGLNNISFSGRDTDKYDAALSVYDQKKAVERLKEYVNNIEEEERNSFFYPTRKDVEKARQQLREEERILRQREEEYESYNPSRYDFIDDVEKGRKQREERLKNLPDSYDDGSNTIWDIMGTSAGDWPFYTP